MKPIVGSGAVEVVAAVANRCGEAPTWDAERRRLIWTDAEAPQLYSFSPASGQTAVFHTPWCVSGIALDRGGGLVLASTEGLFLWHDSDRYEPLVHAPGTEVLHVNDLIADRAGRLYVGTVHWGSGGMEKPGHLCLVHPDGTVRILDEGIELANGLGFSPDDRILYFTDSAARRIYAYDVHPQTGELKNKRVFVQVRSEEGLPDGLTVDEAGYVWSAHWYGGQVVRYDTEGKAVWRLALSVKQVSSIAFGGNELNDLYVTTASKLWRSHLAPPSFHADADLGGSLYRVRLDFRGRLEHQANFLGHPAG